MPCPKRNRNPTSRLRRLRGRLSALSNRINERGFHVDCAFAQAARRIAQEAALAITRLRMKRGLPEFDDGLPGEPDAPFRMIRSIILTPFPSHSEGAHRGEARPDHTLHPT